MRTLNVNSVANLTQKAQPTPIMNFNDFTVQFDFDSSGVSWIYNTRDGAAILVSRFWGSRSWFKSNYFSIYGVTTHLDNLKAK
jgi:hypothetical protein